MKSWKEEKPNKEGLIWIYWSVHSQMAWVSKDHQLTDPHLGLIDFNFNKHHADLRWEYV